MRSVFCFLALSFLTFSGPAAAQDWADWQPIAANDSYIGLTLPDGLALPEIERVRTRDRERGNRQELWSWQSGGIHAFILDDLRYMQRLGKKDLVEFIDQWVFLRDAGFTVQSGDIERSKNRLGNYYFAVAPTADGSANCFLFLQNLRAANPAGYEQAGGTVAAGFVSGFDCQPSESTTIADHAKLMKSYMSGMHRQ